MVDVIDVNIQDVQACNQDVQCVENWGSVPTLYKILIKKIQSIQTFAPWQVYRRWLDTPQNNIIDYLPKSHQAWCSRKINLSSCPMQIKQLFTSTLSE